MPYLIAGFATIAFGAFWLTVWRIVRGAQGLRLWGPAWVTYGANALYCWAKGAEDAYWLAWVLWISVFFGLVRFGRWGYDRIRARRTA